MNLENLPQIALDIFLAGVEAANPEKAIKNCLQRQGNQLKIHFLEQQKIISENKKVHLIAFGKGFFDSLLSADFSGIGW